MELHDSRYFRGQGPLYIADRDPVTGLPTGFTFVGDVTSVELNPEVERFEVKENVSGKGAVGASGIKSVKYAVQMVLRSIKPAHLKMALQGALTVKAAGNVVDEVHKAYDDKFIRLLHTNVSTVVVTNNAGSVTYVADTDYKVHAAEGLIEVIAAGAMVEGADHKIDYAYAAQQHLTVNPTNSYKVLMFAGKNTADSDKQTRCEAYKVQFDPAALDLITDETAEIELSGVVLLDTLRTAGDQLFSWKVQD
jgi:hypothetical protein